MKRRTVHKITPAKESSFDQQFWPVLVAMSVLSGVALGAILTIFQGPWMWGSLLVLPLIAATSIFLLFNLDNSRLRRSLQFAIITSLALHLLILVFASIVNIFQNPYKPNERQVAHRRVRTIEISDQQPSFVWEEPNSRETPEPKVETERQTKPSTNVQPQPVPVQETKPEINPQLVRRETTAESVPRQNRELSQLRRQTRNLQPQSSVQLKGEQVAENKTAPATSVAEQKVESSKNADSVARQPAPQQESQIEPAKATAANESPVKPEVARTSSSRRRATQSDTPTESAPIPSPSIARVRKTTPKIPVANKQAPVAEKIATATTTQPTQAEPSKSASELTRRPTESDKIRPALTNRAKTELSPSPTLARTAQRRPETQVQPSISNETSVTIAPRRSTTESQVVATPVQVENPSRSPESETASRDLNSRTLSVSRSTEGVAGVGRSQNLDRMVGGMTSPASQASDSARRERTQSAQSDARMLTSSRSSDARRSVGATRVPTSAFKAETTAAAKIAGAKTPGERTLESSAARVDAASTTHRDEISAEKGNSTVDLGPIKVVAEVESRRRSGGGQPEVSRLNPESTRRSKDQSDQQPSLVGETRVTIAAPRNQSSAPPSTNALEAATSATFAARAGGESAVTVERWSAENPGDISDQGQFDLSRQLADSRQKANRSENDSSWSETSDDEDDDNKRGTERTRIAQAPVTRSDPGFGIAKADGRSMAKADEAGKSPSESLAANLSRQSTAAIPGSGIGRTAANVLLQAATSLPVIEASPGRRTGNSKAKNADPDLTSGLANNPTARSTRTSKPNAAPTIVGTATAEPVTKRTGSTEMANTDLENLDSLPVTVSRADLSAMDQIQGSKLDILAMEGPAGLGERPDTYIGVMTRPASRDSEQIQPDLKSRFRSSRFGGTPAINPDAVIARDAFRNRSPSAVAGAFEPTTEAAIHLGLEFLARYQLADGSWALNGFDRNERLHKTQLDSDTAATGLALLAFQGAGYNHREFKYARQIDHAIQWLIEQQSADGGLYIPSDNKSDSACRLYSHGIATLALSEAYGMTQDARLKEPAQKALDYISESQDPRKGGWRYFDEPGKKSSDTSVSGWMMMALQSGRLAGLDVKAKSIDSVEDWLDVAADPDNASLYRYNPYAVDSKGVSRIQGRKPTPSMSSVGLLMRIYAGWDRDDPRLLEGAEYLTRPENLPSDSTPQQRDTYYWYYATQVLKFVDGPQWKVWNDQLRPLLTRSQEKNGELAGSWHPYQPVPDRWGAFGGRLYVTTMNLLSLEVRHRMLPIYRQGEGQQDLSGFIESVPAQVSTNKEPIAPKPVASKPIVLKPIVTRPMVEPTLPDSSMVAHVAEANNTELKKPIAARNKLTIVRKPVIIAPNSSDLDLASNSLKKDLRKPSLPIEPNVQPDTPRLEVARTVQPEAPTMTTPVVEPLSEPNPEIVDARPMIVDANPIAESTPKLTATNSLDETKSTTNTDSIANANPRMIDTKRATKFPGMEPATPPDLAPTATPRPSVAKPDVKPEVKPVENLVEKPVQPPVEKPDVQFTSASGRVTLDGQLLNGATVEFIPLGENGTRISARTNELGRFSVVSAGTAKQPGIKIAKYKVSITSFVESPNENVIDFLEMIPAKYNTNSTLTATISGEKKNNYDIQLKSK